MERLCRVLGFQISHQICELSHSVLVGSKRGIIRGVRMSDKEQPYRLG